MIRCNEGGYVSTSSSFVHKMSNLLPYISSLSRFKMVLKISQDHIDELASFVKIVNQLMHHSLVVKYCYLVYLTYLCPLSTCSRYGFVAHVKIP